MTVREFTSKMWYAQQIVIITWQQFDRCKDIDEVLGKALLRCENWQLRSEVYREINNKMVDSYGVMDGYLIVEVHE